MLDIGKLCERTTAAQCIGCHSRFFFTNRYRINLLSPPWAISSLPIQNLGVTVMSDYTTFRTLLNSKKLSYCLDNRASAWCMIRLIKMLLSGIWLFWV